MPRYDIHKIIVLLCAFSVIAYICTPSAFAQRNAMATLQVTSTAFVDGGMIPALYTGENGDHSPQLSWKGAPSGTKSFVIIVDDPDAPAGIWVHWLLFNIPRDRYSIAENGEIPGAIAGKNSWNEGKTIGYRGPLPPKAHGNHRYRFKVYALDTMLNLPEGVSREQLESAMKGHIRAQGMLTGLYERR